MAETSRWSRRTILLLSVLCISLLGNAGLLGRAWWTNQQWEMAMNGIASYAAAMQAHADFANGVRRQYELSEGEKSGYTHRNDGPFEVWQWTYYPNPSINQLSPPQYSLTIPGSAARLD